MWGGRGILATFLFATFLGRGILESSFDAKERIRDAIDIVDLVSRYVPSLRRQGRNFVGRCPWHDDSRPSLQINPERQTFKCWVCDIGGDIFTFVMRIENVDFREALEMLADMAGIALPAQKMFRKGENGRVGCESGGDGAIAGAGGYQPAEIAKPVLYRAMDWLSEKYHRFFLDDPEAESARTYIKERGISDEMIRRFKIGYAPLRPNTLMELIGSERNRAAILEAAGVLVHRNDGLFSSSANTSRLSDFEKESYYDRFRGRVLFPIRDTQDRTVAFGGRLLPNTTLTSPAKYVNSPETPIFTKSKMLYGMDLARNSIRKKKRVIVTEGYTDCLMAHQYGFDETVAVLGTALGEAHVKMLNRFADRIYLILDGDEAGRKRADEVLGLFVAQGADMSILTLPDDQDPCEYLLGEGAESFERLIAADAVDALDHAFRSATDGIDLERDLVASARALDKLLATIALFPERSKSPGDPTRLRVAKMIQRLAERFRISEEEVRRNLREHRARNADRGGYDDRSFSGGESFTAEGISDVRRKFVFPIPEFRDETDESLGEKFGKISVEIWSKESLWPNQLEREYLEFWFTRPEMFESLAEELSPDDFYSPITRQLTALGNDLLDRGSVPSFDRLLLRYDDDTMKNFLVGVDDSAREKNLALRLESSKGCERLRAEIVLGFERQRLALAAPRTLSDLREEKLGDDQKLSKLLQLCEQLRKKQERIGSADLMDEDGPV